MPATRTIPTSRLIALFRQIDALTDTQKHYSRIQEAYDRVCTELESRGYSVAALAMEAN
jgi:hypothetical protein